MYGTYIIYLCGSHHVLRDQMYRYTYKVNNVLCALSRLQASCEEQTRIEKGGVTKEESSDISLFCHYSLFRNLNLKSDL